MEDQQPLAPPAAEPPAETEPAPGMVTVGNVLDVSPPWMRAGAGVGQAMIELLGNLEPRDAMLAAHAALVMFAGSQAPRLGQSASDYSVALLQGVVGLLTKLEAMTPTMRQGVLDDYMAGKMGGGMVPPTDPPSEGQG